MLTHCTGDAAPSYQCVSLTIYTWNDFIVNYFRHQFKFIDNRSDVPSFESKENYGCEKANSLSISAKAMAVKMLIFPLKKSSRSISLHMDMTSAIIIALLKYKCVEHICSFLSHGALQSTCCFIDCAIFMFNITTERKTDIVHDWCRHFINQYPPLFWSGR